MDEIAAIKQTMTRTTKVRKVVIKSREPHVNGRFSVDVYDHRDVKTMENWTLDQIKQAVQDGVELTE